LHVATRDLDAGALLLLGILDAQDRRELDAEVLDRAHQRLVPCRLERLRRMKPVLAPDETEDRVRLCDRSPALHLEDRQRAERRARLSRRPVGKLDADILEVDAGDMEREAALLAAAGGNVEVDERDLGHGTSSALDGGGT